MQKVGQRESERERERERERVRERETVSERERETEATKKKGVVVGFLVDCLGFLLYLAMFVFLSCGCVSALCFSFFFVCVWCCFNRSVGLILGGGVCWVWVVCVAFFLF